MAHRLLSPLLLVLCACSSGEPAAGVVHLDPRLADGRSAARVLAERRTVVDSWSSTGEEPRLEDFAPWAPINAGYTTAEDWPRPVLRALAYRPEDKVVHAGLRHEAGIDAAAVNVIEIDVRLAAYSHAYLRWRTTDRIEGVPPDTLRVEAPYEKSDEVQTVRFALGGHPGWRGEIASVELFPVGKGGQIFDLHTIRLVAEAFSPGHQSLADSGDGGLLGFGGIDRRAWPTDFDVPLFDTVLVPARGRVVTATALPGDQHGLGGVVTFAIDVRAPGKDWETRATRTVTPSRSPAEARWRSLVANIGDLAGLEVELRFRALRGLASSPSWSDPERTGSLDRARVWWGAPVVLGRLADDRPPNVLLVTLDTTRVDAIGCYGGSAPTPEIDRLAAEGILFEEAWSGCNSTLPSHTSMLTGLDVPSHGVLDNRSTLDPSVRTLPEALRAAGYHTAAAVSVHHLQAGYSGLGRGFDQYLGALPGAPVDGGKTIDAVRAWIREWKREGERPFFLWVHLFDPHTPYRPPEAFLAEHVERHGIDVPPRVVESPDGAGAIGRTSQTQPGQFLEGVTNPAYARFLYDATVAYTDELVGRLRRSLEEAGVWDSTAVVLTADHGESLGDNDIWYGHQMVYPPVMRVPLVWRLPEGPRGLRVPGRASTVDITGTLAGYLGLGGFDRPGGADLLELARSGDDRAERRVWFVHSHAAQVGCCDGELYYFTNVGEYLQLGKDRSFPDRMSFLYRRAVDPACDRNLADAERELAARSAERARTWLERASSGQHVRRDLSAEEEAELQALGYAGPEGPPESPDSDGGDGE